MAYLSDIEIAQQCEMKHIGEIAKKADVDMKYIEQYGNYKAKIDLSLLSDTKDKKDGKLILVTAITPTPAGEGKTTTTIVLADGMSHIGKKVTVALREPSLGPVFGVKGGAAGGGYAQVVPMEDINLHFTGDFHAITAANNLLCAIIDNHLQQGNLLGIDQRRILFKRCLDMNDRALRNVIVGLGGKINGVPREDGFMITGEYFDDCIMKQYELEAGDEIWVSTDRSNGIFDIRIGREGVEPIFTGNGTLAEAFSLTVPEAGIYTISCEGRGIEGSIDFQIK